jgi:Na+:H+ antiporter
MTPEIFLLVLAAILVIGIVGELMFERTGVPDVVWLIAVGFILGPGTKLVLGNALVDKETLAGVAPYFGALVLVIVLFDGGSELKLKELSRSAGRGSTLAVFGFLASVAALAAMSYYGVRYFDLPTEAFVTPGPEAKAFDPGHATEGWGWIHAIMFGAILGGSSSAVIMPALSKAGLTPRVANVVKVESAISDVLCVVITFVCIGILTGGEADAGAAAKTFAEALGIGVAAGIIAGVFSVLIMRRLRHSTYTYPLTLAGLMVLYVIVGRMGGNEALAILTTAIIVGNGPDVSKFVGLAHEAKLSDGLNSVHDQMTFIVKSLFFTFLGIMLSEPWLLVGIGVLVGIVLLIARVVAVWFATLGSGFDGSAKGLITVAMPRGMAAGVLAMFPSQKGVAGTDGLPVVVFAAVIATIVIFAGGFPLFKSKVPTEADEAKAEKKKSVAATADPMASDMGRPLTSEIPNDGLPLPADMPPAKPPGPDPYST